MTVLLYDIFDSTIVIIYLCQVDETPLIWAVAGNHVKVTQLLLKTGANIDAKNRVIKSSYQNMYVRMYVCMYVSLCACMSSITLYIKKRIINLSFVPSIFLIDFLFSPLFSSSSSSSYSS